jgi:hypothetical protein
VYGCTPPANQQLQNNWWIKGMCGLGIDLKKKCRAALKDEKEDIIREF